MKTAVVILDLAQKIRAATEDQSTVDSSYLAKIKQQIIRHQFQYVLIIADTICKNIVQFITELTAENQITKVKYIETIKSVNAISLYLDHRKYLGQNLYLVFHEDALNIDLDRFDSIYNEWNLDVALSYAANTQLQALFELELSPIGRFKNIYFEPQHDRGDAFLGLVRIHPSIFDGIEEEDLTSCIMVYLLQKKIDDLKIHGIEIPQSNTQNANVLESQMVNKL